MSAPSLPEDQLLELLVQLQKTTPDSARTILSSQPQITYALMTLMVKLNIVDIEAFQSTLTAYTAQAAATAVQPVAPQPPPPMVPSHLLQSQYRSGTPQDQPYGMAQQQYAMPSFMYPTQQTYANGQPGASQGYGYTAPSATPMASDLLASFPEDQKAMILRIISMTPDQIHRLPPNERTSITQLRATLGLAT